MGLPLRLGLLLSGLSGRWPTPAHQQLAATRSAPDRSAHRLRERATPAPTPRTRSIGTREKINGTEYKLPFVDKVIYRTIKDEATFITALRTAKLDILDRIRWQNVDQLKKSAPQLQWSKWLSMSGTFLAMRVDTKPFDDIRVRRALNFAVNKQEIVKAYYNGHAELFAYPQHPDYLGYFEPLSEMPESTKELFRYDPAKAKKLLAEAGYPNGFSFKVQVCSCNPDHMDLLPLVAAYLEQVGVKLEIQPMEYASFLSAMTTKTNAPGYFMNNGHTNPTRSVHKSFYTKEVGPSNGPIRIGCEDRCLTALEEKRIEMIRRSPRGRRQAPHLAAAHLHGVVTWVKTTTVSARRHMRPAIYARIWVDRI
jgi:peptide/nickel transport system substrate-binding protein